MAHFSDQNLGTTGIDHGWIHDLVRGELHPEAERLIQQASGGVDPQQRIEEATVQFLTELREQFVEYIRIFNGYSEAGARFQETKVYSIAQTAADFMIYRNQIKLLLTNASHGVIQIQFAQHQKLAQPTSPTPTVSVPNAQELLAQMGPFGDVSWTYQGEKIGANQVARYYFAEFVRVTRDQKRARSSNQQALLDQIKTLLQEQGLTL